MRYYPISLDIRGKPVLVAGAGKVALRKTCALLDAGALVTVVAPEADPAFAALPVRWHSRPWEPSDIPGHLLVFAATDQREVNAHIAAEAKRLGIPANVADAPGECDFLVPARIDLVDAQIAISTEGRNPRRAVALRREIEAFLGRPKVESE